MSSAYSFMHPQTGDTRRFRRASEDRLRGITAHAHRLREGRTVAREAAASRDRLQAANQYFLNADFAQRAVWTLMPLLLVVVYGIDVGLFRPIAEYMARRYATTWWGILSASLLVPFLIMGLDVLLGLIRHYNIEGETRWATFWTGAGIVLACVMPLGAIATQLAALSVATGAMVVGMHVAMLAVLAILSLVSHSLLVFSGHPLFEAKAYWLFRWNYFRAIRMQALAQKQLTDEGRSMGDQFAMYSRDLTEWNSQSSHTRIEGGPFDVITREELRDWYGYEIVQLPPTQREPSPTAGQGASQNSTATQTETYSGATSQESIPPSEQETGPASAGTRTEADGEAEYLRIILARRLRDEEDTVHP